MQQLGGEKPLGRLNLSILKENLSLKDSIKALISENIFGILQINAFSTACDCEVSLCVFLLFISKFLALFIVLLLLLWLSSAEF